MLFELVPREYAFLPLQSQTLLLAHVDCNLHLQKKRSRIHWRRAKIHVVVVRRVEVEVAKNKSCRKVVIADVANDWKVANCYCTACTLNAAKN